MDLGITSVPTCSRSESSGSDSGDENFEPSSPKRLCTIATSNRYNKKWEQQFPWLEYDEHIQGVFFRECKKYYGNSSQRTGGAWITKPFTNWKKAVEKMRAHSKSDIHTVLRSFSASYSAGNNYPTASTCCRRRQAKRTGEPSYAVHIF